MTMTLAQLTDSAFNPDSLRPEEVTEVQTYLTERRFYVGKPDGQSGPQTRIAARAYRAAVTGTILDVARTQLGVEEVPRGSNSGAAVQKYQEATDCSGTGWPWCAAYVDWCIARWLENNVAYARTLNVRKLVRPRTAAAFGLIEWGRQVGAYIHTGALPLQAGDLVVFNFSHVGFVEEPHRNTATTLEGNTNDEGSREGYEVARRTRSTLTGIRAFVSFNHLLK